MSTICASCSKQVYGDGNFCPHCGASIVHETHAASSVGEQAAAEYNVHLALLLSEAKNSANKLIWQGIGWIAAGFILTGITYEMAAPGDTYFIFWGLSVYGLYVLGKGIYYRVAPHKLIEKAFTNADGAEAKENA